METLEQSYVDLEAMTDVPECGLWTIDGDGYHADRTAESHSTLNVFRHSIPEYYRTYVSGVEDRRKPTDEMVLGSALHCWVLEPNQFNGRYIAAPTGLDRRTKLGKAAWEKFVEVRNGRTALTQEQLIAVTAMANSLLGHPYVSRLLDSEGMNEQAIRWRDPVTGIQLKSMFDRLYLDAGIALDLKTASDPLPDGWLRQAANLGYYRQAALYRAGAKIVFGKDLDFLHVVVGSQPPYEVVCYELGPASLALGNAENEATLEELRLCRESGRWESRYANEPVQTEIPAWKFR